MAQPAGISLGVLPLNGDQLLTMRLRRQDPDGLVIISFVGRHEHFTENFTLSAKSGKQYDWRIIKGLNVCLLIKPGLEGVAKSMMDVTREAGNAQCWDVERRVGCELSALPTVESITRSQWQWKLDAIPWTAGQNETWRKYGT